MAAAKSKVKVTTSKALQAILSDYDMRISVGIHAEQGSLAHTDEFGESTQKLIDVAAANEFGVGVPERSFVRGWSDEKQAENNKRAVSEVQKAFTKSVNSQSGSSLFRDLDTALERTSLAFEASMRARIHAGIRPENAPSTIARKGSATPLVDTGQLQAGVRAVSSIKAIKRRQSRVKT